MIVSGVEITKAQIDAMESRMMSGTPFTCNVIASCAAQAGVTDLYAAHRAADRILQKHRKAGLIYFSGGEWKLLKGAESEK